MTDFKKGDRVLVKATVVKDDSKVDGTLCVTLDSGGTQQHWIFAVAAELAPDQPLKEGDQVVTLAGTPGQIKAIHEGEAFVILDPGVSPGRRAVTAPVRHLTRRNNSVDRKI